MLNDTIVVQRFCYSVEEQNTGNVSENRYLVLVIIILVILVHRDRWIDTEKWKGHVEGY